MKKNILIVLNAVVYNRGSEALIRGISSICKQNNTENYITLVSSEPEFGEWLGIENIDQYIKKEKYNKKTLIRYIASFLKKIKLVGLGEIIQYPHIKKNVKEQDVIFIVGADNYDITYNMQKNMYRFNNFIRKNTNAKMVLYDCSIDERDITNTLKKDLENFDYITVRENITYENMKSIISEHKLYYYPDPAFTMDIEKISLPEIFQKGEIIGINISNLITNKKYGSELNKILKAYKNMIDYILNNTDKNIILIPHVMKNADLSTLRDLYKDYKENNRVELIENEELNAKQLKYIISNCVMFIGARTHATIAAYSTCVPTLVLGYSVKSKGIAKDIFGTSKNYVLPVSNLDSEDYLVNGFIWLDDNKEKIANILKEKMPEYINKAKSTIEIIEK